MNDKKTNGEDGRHIVTLRLNSDDRRRLKLLSAAGDQDLNTTVATLLREKAADLGLDAIIGAVRNNGTTVVPLTQQRNS